MVLINTWDDQTARAPNPSRLISSLIYLAIGLPHSV